MDRSLNGLMRHARGQSVLIAWGLWLVGPCPCLVQFALAALLPADHSDSDASASPCYLLLGHLLGGMLAVAACFSPRLRRAELWLILAYYCVFWVFTFSLVARRGSVEMVIALLVAAVAPPACGLVRVLASWHGAAGRE